MSLLTRINASRPEATIEEELRHQMPSEPSYGLEPDRDRLSQRQLEPEFIADKAAIHARLVEQYSAAVEIGDRAEVRAKITELAGAHIQATGVPRSRRDLDLLVDSLLDDVLGLGPLEALLADPDITEIMINSPHRIFVERAGRITESPVAFESERQLRQVIDRVVSSVGRRVDESSPMCDARLADGSRVNVVLPPLSLKGPCMTIRKFSQEQITSEDLLRLRTASAPMLRFLEAAVRGRLNIIVSGGTSSGKTTLLNVLSGFIPHSERIVTIEDAAELSLQQDHVIPMESRPPNVEGAGAVTIRDLVRNSLRMRPDRIVVGECRGGEALDMLQAMNTGHEGSMSTVHANSAEDAVSRLETMVLMAGSDLPARAILKQIASSVNLVVQAARLRGGARRIVNITEVRGFENGEITAQELFSYRQLGIDPDGNAYGYHTATGSLPISLEHLRASGEELPINVFQATQAPCREELY